MKVSLVQAKNGETTATCNNLFLHSSYNPTKEAERFVDSIQIKYTPPFIVITEPGLGYVIPKLKEKFPASQIIVIRYCENFIKYNDKDVITITYFNNLNFIHDFLNLIGEENIINTLFLQWPPSSKIFNKLENNFLTQIKECFEKSKTLLVTREYFEKKWLLNTINLLTYGEHFLSLTKKISDPIIIMSSGPSLNDFIPILKTNQEHFFIICLSSAIKVAITNNIIPDLVISTDGGYWAGQHLKLLNKYNVPLSISGESYVPRQLLSKANILPLDYGDGLSSNLLKISKIKCLKAFRNGTVSGTALEFALNNSTNDIYFCGLDLSCQKGFQHCEPNENVLNNKLKDNRINNENKRSVMGEFSQGVLPIYKEWFQNYKLYNRKVYRVINNKYKKNNLGEIKDISVNDFCKIKIKSNKNNNYFKMIHYTKNLTDIKKFINDNYSSELWNKSLFPLSYSSLTHNNDQKEILKRIDKENNLILHKIKKVLYE